MDRRSSSFYRELCEDVRRHCEAKGYRDHEKGVNNFIPHDAIASYAMAKLLSERFDNFVAIAPEGHIYGYFFERDGTMVLSVVADYPPTHCSSDDDLSVLKGKNVLLIEDEVVSGLTLKLVVDFLSQFKPGSMSLYLGHIIGIQHLENIPREIEIDRI